jgi:SlyX protein
MTDLEIRLAHYERMLDEMSEVMARQDQTIDLMAAQIRRLQERLRDMSAGWQASPQDEKPPPHY